MLMVLAATFLLAAPAMAMVELPSDYADYNETYEPGIVECFDYLETLYDWKMYDLNFTILETALNMSAKQEDSMAAKLLSGSHNLTLLAPVDESMPELLKAVNMSLSDLDDPEKLDELLSRLIVALPVIQDFDTLDEQFADLTKLNVSLITEYASNYGYDYGYGDTNMTYYYGDYAYNYTSDYEYGSLKTYTEEYNYTYEAYIPSDFNYSYDAYGSYADYNVTVEDDYLPADYNYTGYYDYSSDIMTPAPLYRLTCSMGYVFPVNGFNGSSLADT